MNEEWIDGYEVLFENERNIGMQKVLEELTIPEQQTLKDRYYERLTYAEIGKKLKVSRERTRQIALKGLRKLRKLGRLQILADHGWERVERALATRHKDKLALQKEWKESQIRRQIDSDKRQKEALQKERKEIARRHKEALQKERKEIARRHKEYERYYKYKRKSEEQRTAKLLESRNDVIQYYAELHKKQAIPPDCVGLVKKKNGQYVLGAQKGWDGPLFPIDISNDPITYNRWLQYLIKKKE